MHADPVATADVGSVDRISPRHPTAPVPARLFTEDDRERRWRDRFSAVRMSRPEWARDAPERCVYVSNASGTTEVHVWDRSTDEHRQLTRRRNGTHAAEMPPDGHDVWWFADTDGDEFGHWVREPFAPQDQDATPEVAVPGAEDGHPAGLDVGRRLVALGTSTDEGSTVWLHERGSDTEARVVYRHTEDAGAGPLSEDETLLAIHHSEHGDSRHPSVRVLRTGDGTVVADLHDGPGRGLAPLAFSPESGDQRLIVAHERRGREELLVWDPVRGTETELDLGLPGEVGAAEFYPDATALLVAHTHAARTRLHRYDLATGELTELPTAPGCVGSAGVRPDGAVEYSCSSAATPSAVRTLGGGGAADELLVTPPGPRPPSAYPVRDVWVDGVHALVTAAPGVGPGAAAVFTLHGGPHAADEDRFDPVRATWADAGFVVVEVNYRGSTGYGSAWRDAIEGRPGLTELADVAAVRDALVADGTVDPDRCVADGWSWGGYLALLAAGTQPDRWAVAVAGVPVADYLAAYADEMEQLRAFDRALFGGSPAEIPDRYREASPLTYVDAVRVPVLVLAGENDPRCPIRQIENYLDALAARPDVHYEVTRFDAGHGSLVVTDQMDLVATEVDFARRALDG